MEDPERMAEQLQVRVQAVLGGREVSPDLIDAGDGEIDALGLGQFPDGLGTERAVEVAVQLHFRDDLNPAAVC